MLELFTENKKIDIGDLKGIQYKLVSPLFKFNEIVGDYSQPFQIPDSPKNREIFGFLNRVENIVNEIKTVPVIVKHSGIVMIKGQITVKPLKQGQFSCNITSNLGAISEEYFETKLEELEFGGQQSPPEAGWTGAGHEYALFPVKNPDFFKDIDDTSSYNGFVNNYKIVHGAEYAWFWGETDPLVPFPYFQKIINYFFLNFNKLVSDNFFADDFFEKLVVFNMNSAVKYDRGAYLSDGYYEVDVKLEYVDLKEHLPTITVKEFILALSSYFNVSFLFSENKVRILNNDEILENTYSININDKRVKGIQKYIIGKKEGVAYEMAFDTNDTGIEVSEEYDRVYKNAKVYHHANSIAAITSYKIGDIAITPFSALSNYIDVFKIIQGISGYKEGWTHFPLTGNRVGVAYYTTGKNVKINTAVAGVAVGRYDYDSDNRIIPFVRQKGNSILHETKNESSLKFLFYLGKDYESTEGSFPVFAGHKDNAERTARLSDSISRISLIQHFWLKTLAYLQNIDYYITTELNFRASEIKNFDFAQKYELENKLYFIDEITVNLMQKYIAPSKCKLIPAN